LYQARSIYDYNKQTDEEISFPEGATLQVFDESDEDWVLVGVNGEYGFAPANYIDKAGSSARPALPEREASVASAPTLASAPIPGEDDYDAYNQPESPAVNPAAALAGLIQQRTGQAQSNPIRSLPPPTQYTPEASDDEAPPPMPVRPQATPPRTYDEPQSRGLQNGNGYDDEEEPAAPAGYHLYNIHEIISHMGKNKKMPTTLGINVSRGIIMIAPEKSKDGPSREWTAEKLSHYSIEGKHVFMELVRPSKSIDFHAGAKDTAKEIVAALGELAGAARAAGLKEVVAAGSGSGQKQGRMLYEFMAQADDEVTVAVGDEVIVLDDTQSQEWWVVRRLKNGKEGSVPSSYVEITGTATGTAAPSSAPRDSSRSVVEQNRREEERATMDSVRTSSRSNRQEERSTPAPVKPDNGKVRTWTDRSGTFRVEAEFLGLKEGKIHLHKLNGVKIAVPISKMSPDDVDYVERRTGQSLDDERPLAEVKRRGERDQQGASRSTSGAAVQQQAVPPESGYDWFDFFLACGVNPQICERYAQIFAKDQMGEENMQDIDAKLLRNLGVKEGDILRVMKHLDAKFGRAKAPVEASEAEGGLFAGADGTLKNNTRKGRPAPAVTTNDTVDPRAFEQKSGPPAKPAASGFDDDAWDVKPATTTAAPQPQRPLPTGAMSELSLLSPPLQPSPAPAPQPATAPLQQQQTGADPSFFDQLARPSSNPQPASMARARPPPSGLGNQNSMIPPAPQRPMSTPYTQQNGSLPQPLMPQRTGFPQIAPPGQSMLELNQQRMMQQQAMMYPQQIGFMPGMMPQQTGYPLQPQQTGFGQPPQQFMQPLQSQPTGNPFGDAARAPFTPSFQPQQTGFLQSQPTGFQQSPYQQMQPQQTGFQPSFQPLQPQQTGFGQPPQQFQPLQPQATGIAMGMNGFGGSFQQQQGFGAPSQLPPMQQGPPIMAPLVPQKTGPPPPVRFGMPNKLTPQATGRRANLASASKFCDVDCRICKIVANNRDSSTKSFRVLVIHVCWSTSDK